MTEDARGDDGQDAGGWPPEAQHYRERLLVAVEKTREAAAIVYEVLSKTSSRELPGDPLKDGIGDLHKETVTAAAALEAARKALDAARWHVGGGWAGNP